MRICRAKLAVPQLLVKRAIINQFSGEMLVLVLEVLVLVQLANTPRVIDFII